MKLEKYDKQNIFKVPENYFEELPQKVQSRIDSSEKSISPFYLRWQEAAPALAVIIILGVMLIISYPSDQYEEDFLTEVSDESIQYFLETSSLTTYELIPYVPNEAFSSSPLEALELSDETSIYYYDETIELLDI